jgi:hypothetical protein
MCPHVTSYEAVKKYEQVRTDTRKIKFKIRESCGVNKNKFYHIFFFYNINYNI